jgi:hypothetical protein
MISIFKNDIIEFFCTPDKFDVIPKPIPAFKMIPEWFKKIQPTSADNLRDHAGAKSMTAKKCMPLLDAMSTGYIIPLFADINVRTNKDGSLIEIGPPNLFGDVISFHDKEQLGGKTSPTYPGNAIKFINHWVIKTAPGYSTLFVPPLNHIEPRFTCLSGLVDTDTYVKEVNFPAIWHAKDYDGLVTAGTPLVTVIPVKRSDLTSEAPVRVMSEKERLNIIKIQNQQATRRHVYTNKLREPRK